MENSPAGTFRPYRNDALNHLYALLFCDDEAAYRTNHSDPSAHPWAVLFAAAPDPNALLQLAQDTSLESRVRALAATKLHALGGPAPKLELLGVVVEVGLDQGLDVLAVFADGTARYINQAESAIIFDAPNATTAELVNNLWQQSITVVNRIGPWDKARLEPPAKGLVRLSFLVSGQLYFGQGPIDMFFKDPMAGPVLHAATQIMQYLTQNAGGK